MYEWPRYSKRFGYRDYWRLDTVIGRYAALRNHSTPNQLNIDEIQNQKRISDGNKYLQTISLEASIEHSLNFRKNNCNNHLVISSILQE